MKRNRFLVLMLFTAILSMVSVKVFAHDIEVANDDGVTIYYVWTNNGSELAVSYRGSYLHQYYEYKGNVVIPESVNYQGSTYRVTGIIASAFQNCDGLTNVTIGNSVLSIGELAFSGCHNLANVSIGNAVTSIGEWAFSLCTNLTNIAIPNSVIEIKTGAFKECNFLTNVTIGNSVKEIGEEAFYKCSALTSVTIGESVTNINGSAFAYCSALTNIVIGSSVDKIGNNAFWDCSELQSVTILSNNIIIDSWAFGNCKSIQEIICYGDTPPSAKSNSINEVTFSAATLYVPYASMKTYKSTEPWSNFDKIKAIGTYYNVTLTSLPGGKIIYEDEEIANESKTFEVFEDIGLHLSVIPDEGHSLGQLTVNGVNNGIENTFTIDKLTEDIKIVVSFNINKYVITYILDGTEYKTYELEFGSTVIPEDDPANKEGYTFSGWVGIPETMPAHTVIVNGAYIPNKYTLLYIVDGAEYKSYEVEYGTAIEPEPTPEKEGYTFSGWTAIPETMPSHAVVITGTFSINSYKLTYMIDDKVYKETMHEYGATITPEPQPEGDYQTFEWTDLPQTMPAHDVTVYANYTSGIAEILMNQGNVRVYGPDGKHRKELRKGLNIVRMSEGSTKKVIVK